MTKFMEYCIVKFAAIDIGSNAIRLVIARPLDKLNPNAEFKSVEFTRLPLRLGNDVFKTGGISENKGELLLEAIQAFKTLIKIYKVNEYKAVATSAMRDADNGNIICKKILDKTGVHIQVISGEEESRILQTSVIGTLPDKGVFLHIDIGGGSTELSLINNQTIEKTHSFNIGTVRLKENKVSAEELDSLDTWVLNNIAKKYKNIICIGTGGNMNKFYQLAGKPVSRKLYLGQIVEINEMLKTKTRDEKVYSLKLNPDRAEVINYAGDLMIEIMQRAQSSIIKIPGVGLKDGILRELWTDFLNG